MARYYDIHAHLADPRILPDIPAILTDSRASGVRGILANAARLNEWEDIIQLSRNQGVYGALGLHPFFLTEWHDNMPNQLDQALGTHRQLQAVGEIGLDFYHGRTNCQAQVAVFAAQVAVAAARDVPVVVHNRKSWSEFFGVLRELDLPSLRGVCHHFSGSIEIARQILDRGFFLSFCGPLTYPNARRLKDAARYAPLDRILTETDTPDLPPARFRGGPSYPHHVAEVVHEIAGLKGVTEEEVATQVEANFHRLLQTRLGPPSLERSCPDE